MADKKFEVGITIGLKDQATAGVRKLSTAFRRTLQPSVQKTGFRFDAFRGRVIQAGRSLLDFSTRIITTAVRRLTQLGAAALAAGAILTEELARRGVNAAADFEFYITRAATMTGKMGDALKATVRQLSDFGIQMAKISMKKPAEIAQSFYDLMSAGLGVTEVMQTFPIALALAEGAGADLHTSTELLIATVKGFGLTMASASRVGNVLAATLSNTRATVERLSIAFPYAAAAAKQVGVSVEETAAALGVLMDRGLEASTAGTSLNAMFAKMVKQTTAGATALAKYGLTVADISPEIVGFEQGLRRLRAANIRYSDMLAIFGLRQAKAGAILSENIDVFAALVKKVTGTNRAFELQAGLMDTLHAQWEAFKGDIQMILITIGRELLPVARQMLGVFREFAGWLVESGAAKRYGQALVVLAQSFIILVTSLVKSGEIKTFFQRGIEAVYNFATVIRELASGRLIQDWIAQIRGLVGGLVETFRTQQFPQMIQSMMQQVWGFIVGKLTNLKKWLNNWLEETFGANWVVVRDTIIDILKAITEVFTIEFAGKLIAAAKEMLPYLVGIVKVFAWMAREAPLFTVLAAGALLFADKLFILGKGIKWLIGLGFGGWLKNAVAWIGRLVTGGGAAAGARAAGGAAAGRGAQLVMPGMRGGAAAAGARLAGGAAAGGGWLAGGGAAGVLAHLPAIGAAVSLSEQLRSNLKRTIPIERGWNFSARQAAPGGVTNIYNIAGTLISEREMDRRIDGRVVEVARGAGR